MTGQGQGRSKYGTAEVSAEVRAVNNRHLKIQTRMSEGLGGLEAQVETLVRKLVRRGSMQINIQLIGAQLGGNYLLQQDTLATYVQQCREVADQLGLDSSISIGDLLALPGVFLETRNSSTAALDEELVLAVTAAVTAAIASLNDMRRVEGASMTAELELQLTKLSELAAEIEERAPDVVSEYRQRLTTRVEAAFAESNVALQEADLIREVAIMADKADIREEIVRLRCHVDQFRSLLTTDESQGRKLDFLTQEMFRESNTIGSKASDADIAQRVVDMKAIIEQLREQVQNVE